MAQWQIRNQGDWDAQHREKHGDEEFERRMTVAKAKTEEVEDWKEQMFYATHFETIAMALKAEHLEVAKDWPYGKWITLVQKMVGVA
jgi:hypothetical protein